MADEREEIRARPLSKRTKTECVGREKKGKDEAQILVLSHHYYNPPWTNGLGVGGFAWSWCAFFLECILGLGLGEVLGGCGRMRRSIAQIGVWIPLWQSVKRKSGDGVRHRAEVTIQMVSR